MDPATAVVATAFANERYPDADLVVVGGSAARTRRPLSDIDLLVIGPASMFAPGADDAAYTERWRGELFEVFASTEEAFRRHQRNGVERLRPVSGFLLVEGVVIVDRGERADLLRWTRELLDAGPRVPVAELDLRRYGVTNALDDLLDADGSVEESVLAAALFVRLGEFVLLANRRWLANGRWLLRRLHGLDPVFADALGRALADRDRTALERLTLRALEPYGGRLMEGYVR